LFKAPGEVLIARQGGIDAIAAITGQPLHIKVLRGPRWHEGHNEEGMDGAWDIGELEVQLAAPAVLHTVTDDGLVGAAALGSGRLSPNDHDDSCAEGIAPLPANAVPLADYPPLKESPLAAFYLAHALPARQVEVLTRARRIVLPAPPAADAAPGAGGDAGSRKELKVALNEIDLDGDHVPDLVVWQGQFPGEVSLEFVTWRAYFVNIAGAWWYAGLDQDQECT
jgi:hypothetical protein